MKNFCVNCIYQSLPGKEVKFSQNESVFLEGDVLDYVYLIEDGLVKINKIFQSGQEKILDILGPNDYIALIAVLRDETNYVATATTLSNVKAKRFSKKSILEAYNSNAKFKDACLQCAVTRTNVFQSHLTQSSNFDNEDKILSVLEFFTKKFGYIQNGKHVLDLPFSKTILASIIGIRRETLSRRLRKMENENILQVQKNKYIFDRM